MKYALLTRSKYPCGSGDNKLPIISFTEKRSGSWVKHSAAGRNGVDTRSCRYQVAVYTGPDSIVLEGNNGAGAGRIEGQAVYDLGIHLRLFEN